jgi:dTDP-4-dehydrorhamnose reductase
LTECDIRDRDRVEEVIVAVDPDVVFNCAALTDVDACETDRQMAKQANTEGPAHIAQVCAAENVSLVHFSTGYVFDGRTDDRYDEDATPNPRQVYGETKLLGERAVREAHDDAIIARLSFVYGTHYGSGRLDGFPAWVRDELAAGESVPLFVDQHVTPSRAGQVAETVYDLLETDFRGIVHLACRSCVTPYEFGRRIADLMAVEGSFERGRMDELDRNAPRPKQTCLSTDRVERILGREQPSLQADLDEIANSFVT